MKDLLTPEILEDWWRCAKGSAAAIKVFDQDPRSEDEIASELMQDFIDQSNRAREALT